MIAASSLLLYALSTQAVAGWLIVSLQRDAPIPPDAVVDPKASAIVVLSAGARRSAYPYDTDHIGPLTFERLRYGAQLHRRFLLPLLLSGGVAPGVSVSNAELMSRALKEEFGIEPRWLEGSSGSTRENAIRSAEILFDEGVSRVYLVTHAWHMPRAKSTFERAGFDVIPAPTAFYGNKKAVFAGRLGADRAGT